MARHHLPALLILFCILAASGAGLAFSVDVSPAVRHATYDLSYHNTTDDLQEVSLVVENDGSVGCRYRLDALVRQGDDTVTRSSRAHPLFPGAVATVDLPFIAYNTTGPVNVTLRLSYCERHANISTFTYEMTGRVLDASRMDSTTERVDETSVTVSLPVDEAILVPREAPALWHPAPALVANGTATVRYDPPIFNPARTLEYSVVNATTGGLIGETTISLEPEETWLDRLMAAKWQAILLVSLLANIALLLVLGRDRLPLARVTRAWKHFKQSRRN